MKRNPIRYSALLGRVIVGAGLVAASVLAATESSALAAPAGVRPAAINAPGALRSVSCVSPSDCWAVGDAGEAAMTQSQVLRWNGVKWTPVDVPRPGGTGAGAASQLNSVRCLNPRDCWAVGFSQVPRQAENSLAMRWNGQHWKIVGTPSPGGVSSGSFSNLTDVSCVTASNCWAVGDDGTLSPVVGNPRLKQVNLVLHWNGTKWLHVKVPNPAGGGMHVANNLSAVRCTSSKLCWAAGYFGPTDSASTHLSNLMLRWNGKKWQTAPVPDPAGTGVGDDNELAALSCTSASDCWAAGTFGQIDANGRVRAQDQLLRLSGRSWSKVKAPNPDGTAPGKFNLLNGVTGASRCFAVGQSFTAGSPAFDELLRWNGSKWIVS